VRLIPAGRKLIPEPSVTVSLGLIRMVSCAYHAPAASANSSPVGDGSNKKLEIVPFKNVCRLVNVVVQTGSAQLFRSIEIAGTTRQLQVDCGPRVSVTWSSTYIDFARCSGASVICFPARPSCACGSDAALPPTTTAPPDVRSGTRERLRRRSRGRLPRKEVARARKSHSRTVRQRGRENVRLLQRHHLFAQSHHVRC